MQPVHFPEASTSRPPTLGGLIMLVGFILIGGVVSTYLLFGLLALSKGLDVTQTQAYLKALATDPMAQPGSWYELMLLQAINHLGTYLVPALVYWHFIERRRWQQFNLRPLSAVAGLGLVGLIVIAFIAFDGLVIEWNQGLHLPETLAPIEQWMRDQEKKLAGITKYLTTLQTTGQFLIALLVIGVIPGIGEEVLFRGILQRNFIRWTANTHVGIWLAAALFSAIHVQFLGLFPRMLLGALFGYLYVWSGNIWVPILAHFVNNGFTVFMVFLYQQKMITMDVENIESVPLTGALVSLVVSTGLLYYFRQINNRQIT